MASVGSGSLGPGLVLAAPSSTQATGSNPGPSVFQPCGLGRVGLHICQLRTATVFKQKDGCALGDKRQEVACACAPTHGGWSLVVVSASWGAFPGPAPSPQSATTSPHSTDGETEPGVVPCPAQDHRKSVPEATWLPVPQCPGATGNSEVGTGLGVGLGSPEGGDLPQGGLSSRVQPRPASAHPPSHPSPPTSLSSGSPLCPEHCHHSRKPLSPNTFTGPRAAAGRGGDIKARGSLIPSSSSSAQGRLGAGVSLCPDGCPEAAWDSGAGERASCVTEAARRVTCVPGASEDSAEPLRGERVVRAGRRKAEEKMEEGDC